jgi:hypothetical protein
VAGAGRTAATTYSTPGQLSGVAAASAGNAWAVGSAGGANVDNILMLHWNGKSWSRVTSPKVLTGAGSLSAITVVNAKDAWAVGYTGSATSPHSLLLHWNGTAWSAVTSPAPVSGGGLSAVTASAAAGWAVGYVSTGTAALQTRPLIFKLTGTKWTRVDPTFGTNSGVALDGVATTSAGVTFATGLYTGQITGVLARWTGKMWAFLGLFTEAGTYHWLNAIAAGPHGNAFAVGQNTSGNGAPLISIEWNGKTWVQAPGLSTSQLNTVTFAPGGAAWAAGSYPVKHNEDPLILRWTGKAWAMVTSPATVAQLNGLGFATSGYGWAVGETNPGTGTSKTLIEHWNGKTWS